MKKSIILAALLCVGISQALPLHSATAAPTTKKAKKKKGKAARGPKTVTTASGLKITDLRLGGGAVAKTGLKVYVNYKGMFSDGKVFDQSYGRGPFDFVLGEGNVIKGWDEGVAGMKVGGKRKLVIPPDIAYGPSGTPDGTIPPNATLTFEVELLKVG